MQSLTFRLGDPSYTLLHRAGLAGLWMTLKQLQVEQVQPPEGFTWELQSRQIKLFWKGNDQPVLAWLLGESFQLNNGLIALRGIDSKTMRRDAQVIVHQGILGTFLQHTSTHKAEGTRTESLDFDGENVKALQVSYKVLSRYVHQEFASNLCDKAGNLLQKPIGIAGWLNPGAVVRHVAFSANTSFEETPSNAFVLLFAPVACYYYSLRSRLRDKRSQYALVIPEITDLELYAQYRQDKEFRNAAYRDFFACGLGDAGLRFLTYDTTINLANACEVPRCQILTLGTVAWATQQKTRTDLYLVEAGAEVCQNYKICDRNLPDRVVKSKDGSFIASSFAREFIAENLARGMPWYTGFADKVTSNELFQKLTYERGGIYRVVQKIQSDELDKLYVQACHEAIEFTYGKVAGATKEGEIPNFERATVRIRTGLSRCKTAQSFREFMTDFWSRAGKLPTLQKHWADLMQFVMDEKQWKKGRDLALLALASYSGKEKPLSSTDRQDEAGNLDEPQPNDVLVDLMS